jgi:DNA-binding transcriptional LysR family regulator
VRGTNIDLKLLAIINELHRTRSVSHAAENLRLSQSTISMSLAKLRRHFNDRLFVRTSKGMEPTPHAKEVLTLLSKAKGLIHAALGTSHRFRPGNIGPRVPHLLHRYFPAVALEVAPAIQVNLLNIPDSVSPLLEAGEVDLAIGNIPPMGGLPAEAVSGSVRVPRAGGTPQGKKRADAGNVRE